MNKNIAAHAQVKQISVTALPTVNLGTGHPGSEKTSLNLIATSNQVELIR